MTAESVRKIRVRVTEYSAAPAIVGMPLMRAHWITCACTGGLACDCTDPFETISIAASNSAAISDELVKWNAVSRGARLDPISLSVLLVALVAIVLVLIGIAVSGTSPVFVIPPTLVAVWAIFSLTYRVGSGK